MKLIKEVAEVYRNQEYGQGIDGVKVMQLRRFTDDGGSMTELARVEETGRMQGFTEFQVRQMNYSTIEPGVIKAFHVHQRQRDIWFVPPEDRVLLVLVDVREDSPTKRRVLKVMLGGGTSTWVSIDRGIAHGFKNIGERTARVIYLTDLHFSADPETTDEGRLPWDMVGAEIWEPAKD